MILAVILLASHIFHFKFHVTFKGFTHYLDLHHGEESQWCPLMSETVHYYLSLNPPIFFPSPPCERFDKCQAGCDSPARAHPGRGAASKAEGLQLSACLMQDLVMVILANPPVLHSSSQLNHGNLSYWQELGSKIFTLMRLFAWNVIEIRQPREEGRSHLIFHICY